MNFSQLKNAELVYHAAILDSKRKSLKNADKALKMAQDAIVRILQGRQFTKLITDRAQGSLAHVVTERFDQKQARELLNAHNEQIPTYTVEYERLTCGLLVPLQFTVSISDPASDFSRS